MQRQLVSLFHRNLCSGVQRSYSSKIKCITDKMMATKQDKSVKPKTKVNMGNMMKKDSSISDDSSVKVKEARAETVTRSQLQIQEKPSADNPAHDRVTTEKVQDKDTSESRDKKETRDGSLTRSQIPKPVDVRVTTEKVQDKDTSESRDKKETRDGSLTRSQIPKPVDVRVTTEKVQDKDTSESRDKKETRDGSLTRSQIPKPVDVRVTTEKVQDKDTSDSRDNSTKKKETRHGSLTRSQIPKPVDVRGHYLNLKLEDKRKEYRCGNRYMNLSEILTWPDYYKDFLFLNYTAKKKKVDKKNADKKNAAKSYQSGEDVAYEVNTNINSKVSLWKGDITTLEIDAIVNAANSSLLGGGGVDGAIHSSAGLDLLAECRKLDGCHQGDAKITGGYKLPAKYVIHTVGPIGRRKEEKSDMCLRKCYDSSLNLMLDNKLKSLALPCISTGIYGFPNDIACAIALHTVREFLNTHADLVDRIIFCVFLKQDVQLYEHLLPKYFPLETILPADSDTDRSKETQDSGDMKYEDLNSSNNTKHSPVPADDKSTKKSSDVSADDKSNKKSSDVSADDKSNKKSSDVFADDKSNKKSSDVFADDKSTKKRSDVSADDKSTKKRSEVSADDQPTAKYLLESEMEEHSDNEMDVDVNTEGTDDMEWTDSQTENLPGGETFSQKDKTVVENDSEKPTEKQFQETSV